MRWFAGLETIVSENERLAPHTSFRLGGPARWLVRPENETQLSTVLSRARNAGLCVRMLGRGANLLIRDHGVDAVVVQLSAPYWRHVEFSDDTVLARAGANVPGLVVQAVRRGLTGLERMAGIPGSVGGCVRMNAGGRAGCMADIVRRVRVMNPDGGVVELNRDEIDFDYRTARLGDRLVLSAALAVEPDDPTDTRQRCLDIWDFKRRTQPLGSNSAGCIFKNPPGKSAGQLIDAAGLKGERVGGAAVSDRHANFIVADHGATADDVLRLIERVQHRVHDMYAVDLGLEVELW